MNIDSKAVGQNIARIRKLKDIKAADLALQLGLKEAAYTKYERGETFITLEFIQKVAAVLKIDPAQLLASNISNIFDNFQHSPVSIHGTSTYHAADPAQNERLVKLMESVIEMNKKLIAILEQKGL